MVSNRDAAVTLSLLIKRNLLLYIVGFIAGRSPIHRKKYPQGYFEKSQALSIFWSECLALAPGLGQTTIRPQNEKFAFDFSNAWTCSKQPYGTISFSTLLFYYLFLDIFRCILCIYTYKTSKTKRKDSRIILYTYQPMPNEVGLTKMIL